MKIKKLVAGFTVLMMAGSLAACGRSNETRQETGSSGQRNTLIVYFSRFGNTGYPDDIDASTSASVVLDGDKRYGTTEYIAGIIRQSVGGDLHLIETKNSYPEDFDEVTEKNHDEMDKNYLPPLKESNLDISKYDTVFIGYPVWATDVPQAVLSFLEEYDLSGKTVIPFCTHDGYGGREYYGGIEFTPKKVSGGQLNFENGDITYCETNNSMAIFYAQTDHPNLTMEVIPIGKVTSDLSVFDTFDSSEDVTFTLPE